MMNKIKNFFNKSLNDAELAINDLRPLKIARRKFIFKRILKITFFLLSIYFVIFVILALLEIKTISTAMINAYRGKLSVQLALDLARQKKLADAVNMSEMAQKEFNSANLAAQSLDASFLNYLPGVSSQVTEVAYLIQSADILVRALNQGLVFASDIDKVVSGSTATSYANFSTEQKRQVLAKIYVSAPEINGMKANFDLALMELNKLKLNGVLWPMKYNILDIRNKVKIGSDLLAEAVPLSQILPALAGYPANSTYLVLLQNEDELRATGGFIGTYGILETSIGDIARFDTHDIYHMDMPVKDQVKVVPPDPIKLYLNKDWYFRDSNWWPDWPTSAKQAQWFYREENRYLGGNNDINKFEGQFSGVIAINPGLVVELLKITGPIAIGNEIYNHDNFTQLLEYKVEKGHAIDGVSSWQRKEVIGEIVKEMKIRLLNLPSERWPEFLTVVNKSLLEKKLLIYFNDQSLQSLVADQGWAGDIRATKGDYVLMVDSNMASLKSDSVITRTMKYRVEPEGSKMKATMTIKYDHAGKIADWRTSRYKDYARLYVPLGSELILFDGATVPVSVYEESGKTVFGSLFYIELDSTKEITISYYLPESINAEYRLGKYSLLWQKQASSRVNKVVFDYTALALVNSMSPESASNVDNKNYIWENSLTQDWNIQVNK